MINYVEVKRDQYILRGLHTKAENEKALVVMFHGFIGHLNENGFFFKKLASEFAKCGISSIRFDFMGNGMSDGELKDMTFKTECDDARAIIRYCLEHYNTKLYALGFSFGGAVLGYVAKDFKDELAKIVLASPAGNMNLIGDDFKNLPPERWYDEENIDMGGYLISKKFIDSFEGVDLYANIAAFKHPVLIVHGELDKSVPIEYGHRYEKLLDDVKFVTIKESSHCYTTMKHRAIVNQAIIEFLTK